MSRGNISPRVLFSLVGCCGSPCVQNPKVFHAHARTRKKTTAVEETCRSGKWNTYQFILNSPRPAPSIGWAGGRVNSVNLRAKYSAWFHRNFCIFKGADRDQ